MSKWVSVKKKKPQNCDLVPILLEDETVVLAGYQKNSDYEGWFDDFDEEYEPTHWLPLPPHPEGAD